MTGGPVIEGGEKKPLKPQLAILTVEEDGKGRGEDTLIEYQKGKIARVPNRQQEGRREANEISGQNWSCPYRKKREAAMKVRKKKTNDKEKASQSQKHGKPSNSE